MKVVAINKKTKEEIVLGGGLTEEEATRFCEMWGWSYCDENMVSWWLEVREE